MLTESQKLKARLNEYKKTEYVDSFICENCRMYNEYITSTPMINGTEIVFAFQCKSCGHINFRDESTY